MDPFLLAILGLVAVLCGSAVVLSGRKGTFWLGFGATLVPLTYVDRYHFELPSAIKWLPEFAIVGAALATAALARSETPRVPARVLAAMGAFVALSCVSWLYNGSSAAALIVSLRGLVLLGASLWAQRAVREVYDKDRVLGFLVAAGLVSAVVCLLQRATIATGQADRVTGLYSLGELMLFFHLLAMGITVLYWIEGRRILRWNAPAIVLLLALSLAVGNQEAAFPYMALVLGYLILRGGERRLALLGGGVALGVAVLGVFALFYDADYSEPGGRSFASSIFDWQYLERYVFGEGEDVLTPGGDLRRGAAVRVAYEQVEEDASHLWLGRGPGATSESGISGATGPLARAHPGIGRVNLSLLIGDLGLGGTLLYVIFILAFLGRTARDEPTRHERVRELFVLLSAAFLMYARLCYEPAYVWAAGMMLLPSSGSKQRP
jgi:hypothetical protein